MQNEQLRRTLKVMRRTGDKAFVMDMDSDEVFVLMPVDSYEDLLDQTETTPPFDNNDNDAGAWPSFDDVPLDDFVPPAPAPMASESFSSKKKNIPVPASEPLDFSQPWDKVGDSSLLSEESLADVPNDEEEEKFYLEPVE